MYMYKDYIFIVFIVNYDAKYGKCEDHEEISNMWMHLDNCSRSIEVNYVTKNYEILTKVYFPFAPNVRYSTHIILTSMQPYPC